MFKVLWTSLYFKLPHIVYKALWDVNKDLKWLLLFSAFTPIELCIWRTIDSLPYIQHLRGSKPLYLCFIKHSVTNYYSWHGIFHSLITNISTSFVSVTLLPIIDYSQNSGLDTYVGNILKKIVFKDLINWYQLKYFKVLIICSSYNLIISCKEVSQGFWKTDCQMLKQFCVCTSSTTLNMWSLTTTWRIITNPDDKMLEKKHLNISRTRLISFCLRNLNYQCYQRKLAIKILNGGTSRKQLRLPEEEGEWGAKTNMKNKTPYLRIWSLSKSLSFKIEQEKF